MIFNESIINALEDGADMLVMKAPEDKESKIALDLLSKTMRVRCVYQKETDDAWKFLTGNEVLSMLKKAKVVALNLYEENGMDGDIEYAEAFKAEADSIDIVIDGMGCKYQMNRKYMVSVWNVTILKDFVGFIGLKEVFKLLRDESSAKLDELAKAMIEYSSQLSAIDMLYGNSFKVQNKG